MTEQSIAREWFVMPNARREALAQWCALRADENRRAAERTVKDDAASGPDTYAMKDDPNVNGKAETRVVPTTRRTVDAMADRASLVMPISGVHVMPMFGKGESVAPYLGDSESAGNEITPADEVTWEAFTAWRYVARHTMGDAYMARVMSIMTSEAIDHGRPVDWSKRDDVASVARALFVDSVAELMTRADVYSIPADEGSDNVGGIGEWGVSRAFRCGECEGCQDARESESAARASRYSVKGCDAPRTRVEWVTPSRLLSRAIWRAAGDATLATSSIYATRSQYLDTLAAMAEQDTRVSVDGTDALSHIPAGMADLLRLIASACEITGDNVVAHNGGLSPAARTLLCLALGTADTKAGTTTALGKLRAIYTPVNRRERAERRAHEGHARKFVAHCTYCQQEMSTPAEDDAPSTVSA